MDSVDSVLIAKEKPEKPKTYKNQEIQVNILDRIDRYLRKERQNTERK